MGDTVVITQTDPSGNFSSMSSSVVRAGSSGPSAKPKTYNCKDSRATNFKNTGIHKQSLCEYDTPVAVTPPVITVVPAVVTPGQCVIVKKTCPIFTQHMKLGDRDGKRATHRQETGVSSVINEVKLLQSHLKKQGFYNGKVDGYYGKEVFYAVSK